MKTIITRPDSGMKLSCIALTDPLHAAVVEAAQSAESIAPKRCSLPSMLAPARCSSGLPAASCHWITATPAASITSIATNSARPWRMSRAIRPKVMQKAAGISRITSVCTTSDTMVGFSNGCAAFTP